MSSCRWCGAGTVVVLDLGDQPAADHFPRPTDPLPDPVTPLAMVLCPSCGLAQLKDDATVPDEPRGVEPRALREQADDAVARVSGSGLLPAGARVREFGSPHGGSWERLLTDRGLRPVGGSADVVLDVFGLMHAADQRAALAERVAAVAPGGLLLVQFHSLAAIIIHGTWNALRHGHFAYYSVPSLVRMAADVGFGAVAVWEFDLYGGTVLLAFRAGAEQAAEVAEVADRELAAGVRDLDRAGTLQTVADKPAVRRFLFAESQAGRTVLGYGAASRTAAVLVRAGVGPDLLAGVADASTAKQGRTLPVTRVPVMSPDDLVRARPDRVLLFVADLLPEVRAALPEVEATGGAWVLLEPDLRVVAP